MKKSNFQVNLLVIAVLFLFGIGCSNSISFDMPKGPKGEQGDKGDPGEDGHTPIYNHWCKW